METKLSLERREGAGKGVARKLRQAGRVPGVVYGGGEETVMVSLEAQAALHLFQSISVENTVIDLEIGGGAPEQALVREIQTHPYRTELIHVDFIRIQRGVTIEVQIPLHLIGTPEGVRAEGGILEHIVHDIPVKCIPSKIPEFIEVEVLDLAIGDGLRGKDLIMPEGVESLLDPERTVCQVSAPRVIEEEVEVEDEVEGEVEGEPGEAPAEGSDSEESSD